MASPSKIHKPSKRIGLPLFHAGQQTGKWQLAASGPAASRVRMERPLHRSRPRRRNAVARHSGSLLQSGIRQRLLVGAGRPQLGCGAICGLRSRRHRSHNNQKGVANRGSRILALAYVCERDHRPVHNGELEFDLSQAAWLRHHDDPRIQKMAECFLESYLKKKA